MKKIILAIATAIFVIGTPSLAALAKKSVLDNDPDLFALVTPDRLLGKTTRRQWLTLWPKLGQEYWAAWDCKGKRCDTPQRAHIRETAKLIPRTEADPEPVGDDPVPAGQ